MIDQRDPQAFPRSSAYRAQPGMVKVSAAALALAYCHIHTFEHLDRDAPKGPTALGQRERWRAEEAGWWLFEKTLVPAMVGGCPMVPLPPGLVFTDRPGGTRMHLATDCLAESVKRTVQVLEVGWEEFLAFCRSAVIERPATAPAAWIHPDELATVLWLEDAVRRFAAGCQPYQAARGAWDRARHRPRRRRQPVDPGWLAGEVDTALTALWFVLLHSRIGGEGGPLWLHGPLVDETGRPIWEYPTESERR
jgi:hypothetical protein